MGSLVASHGGDVRFIGGKVDSEKRCTLWEHQLVVGLVILEKIDKRGK